MISRQALCALLAIGMGGAIGCAGDSRSQTVSPGDFVRSTPEPDPHEDISRVLQADDAAEPGEPSPGGQPPAETGPSAPRAPGNPASPGGQGSTAPPAAGAPVAQASPEHLTLHRVDAMIGQANGRAIYADTILRPLQDQLRALARQNRHQPAEFRNRARPLVETAVRTLVLNALILGEAERDLSDRERAGLQQMVARKREELLRVHGQGSVSLAEHNLRQNQDLTLDEALEEFRQSVLIERFYRQRLFPKINVTRWDIERYYRDNANEFNPQASRVLRVIRVQHDEDAEVVQQLLREQSFEEVAQSRYNLYRPATGGLIEDMRGAEFGSAEMNEAIPTLRAGQWAGPFPLGTSRLFVYIESTTQATSIPLREAQPTIERRLREQQFRVLMDDFNRRMFEQGSYNPVPEMVDSVLRIAVARHLGQT